MKNLIVSEELTLKNLCILYFEDHPASRQVMKLLLEDVIGVQNVYIYESTDNLEEIIQQIQQPIDLVFTDLNIKPLDGYEVCTFFDQYNSDIPVVGLSANVTSAGMRRMQESGFAGLLLKPLRHGEFPLLLQQILDGKVVWEG